MLLVLCSAASGCIRHATALHRAGVPLPAPSPAPPARARHWSLGTQHPGAPSVSLTHGCSLGWRGETGFLSWWLLACGRRGLRCGAGCEGEDPHHLRCSPAVQGRRSPLKHCFGGRILSLEEAGFCFLGEQKPPVQLRCSQALSLHPAPRI